MYRNNSWIVLLLLIPAFVFRDYTPNNELKYISIVEEALHNNTWFTFYNQGAVYADKPPLYFWLLMAVRLITGTYPVWIVGLFSLLPVAGIMLVMDKWLAMEGKASMSWPGGLLMVTTGIFLGGALVVRMDMLMTFFIVLFFYTFYRVYKEKSRPAERWLLPLYLFLALFTKGPVGILIPFVSVFTFLLIKKDIKKIGRYFGYKQWGMLLLLCAVWFTLIYREGGWEYLNNILFRQTVGRGVNSFHHKEAFYFYAERLPLTLAPWSLFYMSTFVWGVWKKKITSDMELFFAVIVGVGFILLSVISSKIDIYLLPVYPFIAYLSVLLLRKASDNRWIKLSLAFPCVLFVLLFPASFFLTDYIPYPYENLLFMYAGLFFISAGGVVALLFLATHRIRQAIIVSASGILCLIAIASFALPQFNAYIGFGMLAEKGKELAIENKTDDYVYYNFRSGENMDVLVGKQLRKAESLDVLQNQALRKSFILFLKAHSLHSDEALKKWLTGKAKIYQVGEYYVAPINRIYSSGE